ncbi:putative bifunctional diguanylate cyclase/phosphodiesterase [Vibrio nitrifigilis]|uniref:Bifunctional diguanylate cyclase/phosphodiesterase n=1 Tax=Vibrio nitrifigilis TaxID=2789781 RepID=A0ABS0GIN5_9VIBR|nr:bifunctional diguanylate cyclase/phosphodiesterase [Vibrio nitrifigilis]MBF9002298.1 bifunctional diguanylate cyclase/phosphodiesterase [Vibrio nitrifigilis]
MQLPFWLTLDFMFGLFTLQIALFSVFPLYFTTLDGPLRKVSYYLYIALVLLIGGFFGNVYSLPINDHINVSGGNLCYGAFMMSSVLFVWVERDLFILRHLVRLVIFVDLFNVLFSTLVTYSLRHPGIINPHNTPAALFDISTPFIILGGFLIILELLTLLFFFDKVKRWPLSPSLTMIVYVASFITILCIDGIVFPLLAFGFSSSIIDIVFGGLEGKILTASCFSIPLLLFAVFKRQSFISYLESSDFKWPVLLKTSQQLMADMQEKEYGLEKAATIYNNSNQGLAFVDKNGKLLQANPAFHHKLNLFSPKALHNLKVNTLFRFQGEPLSKSELLTDRWKNEVSYGRQFAHQGIMSVSKVTSEISNEETFVISLVNIDAQKQAREKLNHLALHDQLTGLPNRRVLDEQLAQVQYSDAGLLVVDLDHFKDINDSYGHGAGDTILTAVSERLSSIHNQFPDIIATLCRTGGDEFAILVNTKDEQIITKLIHHIQDVLKKVLVFGEQTEVFISATIGASTQSSNEARDLLQEADAALYEAKRTLRGSFGLYEERLTIETIRKLTLSAKLKIALKQGEIEVYYQPQYTPDTHDLLGVEALARWHDNELGWVSPGEFIPVAEETGLIEALGDYVLEQACLDGAQWIKEGYRPIKLSVNVSAYQLRFGQFMNALGNALKVSQFPSRHLQLELTESAYIEREEEVLPLLNHIKQLGVGLAIDDFGTGYSSLSYLSRMPWDTLKIDRSFITDIPNDIEQCKLTSTIISMAQDLGLSIVVEGVETKQQLDFMAKRQCQLIQGYYYSPPIPAAQLRTRLTKESGHL